MTDYADNPIGRRQTQGLLNRRRSATLENQHTRGNRWDARNTEDTKMNWPRDPGTHRLNILGD